MNLNKTIFLLLALLSGFVQNAAAQYQMPEDGSSYDPVTIILKLRKLSNSASSRSLSYDRLALNLTEDIKVESCIKMFEESSAANTRISESQDIGVDRIYKVKLDEGEDLQSTINSLLENEEVEYAEPYFLPVMLDIPNDPFADPAAAIFEQDYLEVIQAYDAWNVSQGDESIVIAILDSGTDPNHEDISGNFSINEDEIPSNGIDDDNDGFIDNVIGYDLADDDSDVFAAGDSHGTQVTGISSASTDNGVGMAGIGYNSKLMIIKVFTSDGDNFNMGYEGIKIAADLGADVINLSWGAAGQFFQFGQDMIDYAVLVQDAVVVAAAGNTNEELTFFPAAFNNVLSVTASSPNDVKTSFATYSTTVDLIAPGLSEFTTDNFNAYRNSQGTSFSSPMVAGVAALVKAVRPDLNAVQIMEQLRVSSDDIYSVGNNQLFFERLGFGRLNAFRAVDDNTLKSVRFDSLEVSGPFNELLFNGDTIELTLHLTNYLAPTENLILDFSSESPWFQALDNNISFGPRTTLQSFSRSGIKFFLDPQTPPEEDILIRVGYTDNNYSDYQYFTITTAPENLEVSNQRIETSINSLGQLGFGSGSNLLFDGDDVLESAGLILAKSPDTVSSNTINSFQPLSFDNSFNVENSIKIVEDDAFETSFLSVFDDSNDALPLGLTVEQNVRSFNQENLSNILIFEYAFENNSSAIIDSAYAGFFADWVLSENEDQAFWDAEREYGYVSSPQNNRIIGIAAFSLQEKSYYAIDRDNLNGNIADLGDDFSDEDKYRFLSEGISKTTAGLNGGNNVAHLTGTRLPRIEAGENTKVAFVVFGVSDLEELDNTFDRAGELLIPEADFSTSSDTLFLGDNPSNNIQFTDESSSATLWNWDFGNGFTSQLQNPLIPFNETGVYTVELIITSVIGFSDTVSRTVTVLERPELPEFDNLVLNACINTSISFEAINSNSIRVYSNPALNELFFEGSSFNSSLLLSDEDFYVVNFQSGLESLPVRIEIEVESPELGLLTFPDTTDLSSPTLARLINLSPDVSQTSLFIEGESMGSEMDLIFDYAGLSSINIELRGETLNSCMDTLFQVIDVEPSPLPVVQEIDVCPGDEVLLTPSNGSFFNFYNDRDGSNLIGKGSVLSFTATRESSVFVAGNDNFGESQLVEVPLNVDDLTAGLEFSTNPLNLNSENTVVLQNTTEFADSSFWFFNGVLLRNANDTTLTFNKPGSFTYGVMAFRGATCVDTAFQTLTVSLITSTGPELTPDISIFPNPASDVLFIDGFLNQISSSRIFDLSGREFPVRLNDNRIDVSELPDGLYLVELSVDDGELVRLRFFKD